MHKLNKAHSNTLEDKAANLFMVQFIFDYLRPLISDGKYFGLHFLYTISE